MANDDGDSSNEARSCNQQWRIREESDDYPQDLYPCYPELFWIKVHHGGVFSEFPHRVYQCGKVDYVDLCNRDIPFRFGELKNIARNLGYDDPCNLFFHYLIPGDDLDLGLRELSNDLNAVSMLKHLGKEQELSLYIEVGESMVNRKEDVFDKEQKKVIDSVFNDIFNDVMNPENSHGKEPVNDVMMNDEENDEIVDHANEVHEAEVDMRGFNVNLYVEKEEPEQQTDENQVEVEEFEEAIYSDSLGGSSSGEEIDKKKGKNN